MRHLILPAIAASLLCSTAQAADLSVSIVDTADHSVAATLKFEVRGARAEDITPVGITMTKDGKRAFVSLGRANHIAFVDIAARKVTDLVLVGKRAWNVALDKAEKRLFVVNGLSDDITVVDVAGAKALLASYPDEWSAQWLYRPPEPGWS